MTSRHRPGAYNAIICLEKLMVSYVFTRKVTRCTEPKADYALNNGPRKSRCAADRGYQTLVNRDQPAIFVPCKIDIRSAKNLDDRFFHNGQHTLNKGNFLLVIGFGNHRLLPYPGATIHPFVATE